MRKNILIISLVLLAAILPGCVHQLYVDVKPQSCPNPLNLKSKGVLTVAILGTEDFDVLDVDITVVTLLGVPPILESTYYEDVSTPVGEGAEECECTDAGPDGYLDLVLHFDTQEVVAALEEFADAFDLQLEDGVLMPLLLFEGAVPDPENEETWDDMDRVGGDCVVIHNKDKASEDITATAKKEKKTKESKKPKKPK